MKKPGTIHPAIAIILLVLVTSGALAQESHVAILLNNVNSRLNYGSSINRSLHGYKKDLRGFQAGLSWQKGFTKNFSMVTEAYYVKKGGTLKAGNPLNDVKSTLKLFSVEMPVLARWHVNRFYFNAGPYVTYIVRGRSMSDVEESHSISFGIDGFRRFEAGFQGGAGWQFKIKRSKLALDVRYTHGLTSISRVDNLYNRTINVNIVVRRSFFNKKRNDLNP